MTLALLIVILLLVTTSQYALEQTTFIFAKSKLSYRTNSQGQPWKVFSKIECLSKCLSSYKGTCQSFMYNTTTLQCTPGASIHNGLLNATSEEEELYVKYPDFRIPNNVSANYCLVFFPYRVTYWNAREKCRVYDAYLYVPRSEKSFPAFTSLINPTRSTWVGLRDLDVNGTFVTEDSDQGLNISTIRSLFAPNQPDGKYPNYCLSTWPQYESPLDDHGCDLKYSFVCQKDGTKC